MRWSASPKRCGKPLLWRGDLIGRQASSCGEVGGVQEADKRWRLSKEIEPGHRYKSPHHLLYHLGMLSANQHKRREAMA
jgi:hypothetical protein